jgi:hypothetical protein
LEPLLGSPYFRAYAYQGYLYVITWGGEGFRRGEVHRVGDVPHLFYTRMGNQPERILHTSVALTRNRTEWTASPPATVLEPELDWEGADLPLATSVMGAVDARVRELRDPRVFEDTDGKTYLLYCGAGESGIGLAALSGRAEYQCFGTITRGPVLEISESACGP